MTWDAGTWDSGFWDQATPSDYFQLHPKPKSHMKRQDYYPSRIGDQVNWLDNYSVKLPLYGATLGVAPADVAASVNDAKWSNYVLALAGDLSHAAERGELIKKALQFYPAIDILVTNTGGPPAGKFEDVKQEDWDAAYKTLLSSVVGLVNGFLPGMKQQRWGRIVSITSMAVKQPVNNLILSNSVRASVAGLMKSLSNELAMYNITVNNVMPGYTETERLKALLTN